MEEALQNKIVADLKKKAHEQPDLVAMNDDQLQQLMVRLLENKIQWARTNDPELCSALLAVNYHHLDRLALLIGLEVEASGRNLLFSCLRGVKFT